MNNSTLRRKRSHPSLFPLRMLLVAAEMESPARPPNPPRDPDEMLAKALIEKIRHPKPVWLGHEQIEIPQPSQLEVISVELASDYA